MTERVIILGAGISGLSLGWRLAESGFEVDVLESSGQIGGLAGTVRHQGYSVDFGPHSFFTEDDEIRKTVLELFSPPLLPKTRRVKFFYQQKYLDYPFTPTTLLFQMGLLSGIQTVFSFIKSRLQKNTSLDEEQSVEEWAVSHFGEHLYRTFFKPYTEQFWQVSCRELSARSIPSHTRMSFMKTLKHLLKKRLSPKQASLIDREKLPTYYPQTGYGEIADQVAKRAVACGARIHLNAKATEIHLGNEPKVYFEQNGEKEWMEGSHIVSTLPLPTLISMIQSEVPEEVMNSSAQLSYRPLIMLGLMTSKQNILKSDYIYMLDRPYNRIAEMNQFSEQTSPEGKNLLALEIPCGSRQSAAWKVSEEELFEKCIPFLAQDKILQREEVEGLLLIKSTYAYPIYKKGYKKHLEKTLEYMKNQPQISTLGRSGEFMYMDIDKCIRRSFDLAEHLIASKKVSHEVSV